MTRRRLLRSLIAGSAGLASGAAVGCVTGLGWTGASRRPGRLRLAFYSDVHARTEWQTPRALALAAEAIRAERPDLVFAGGDLITDGFESSAEQVAPRFDVYMQMHRAIGSEVHACIGNHDLVAALPRDGSPPAADPRAVFRSRLGLDRTYYSFDALGYHFVVLDSIEIVGGRLKYQGRIAPEQLAWLRDDLARVPTSRPVVAVSHIPWLTSFYGATHGLTEPAPANRVLTHTPEVLELFAEHHLLLVLQGHLHVYERLSWRGTHFVTGGAISGKWWRGAWHGTPEGFCVITLDGGRVESAYRGYGWKAQRPANA